MSSSRSAASYWHHIIRYVSLKVAYIDGKSRKKKHMENVFSVLSLFSSGSSGTNEKLLHMYNVMAHICNCQTFVHVIHNRCILYGNSWNNASTKHIFSYTSMYPISMLCVVAIQCVALHNGQIIYGFFHFSAFYTLSFFLWMVLRHIPLLGWYYTVPRHRIIFFILYMYLYR